MAMLVLQDGRGALAASPQDVSQPSARTAKNLKRAHEYIRNKMKSGKWQTLDKITNRAQAKKDKLKPPSE